MHALDDQDLTPALAAGPNALFAILDHRLGQRPGYDLFTILAPDAQGAFLERLYSTNQAQYPLGPADAVKDDIWFRQLFSDRAPIIANSIAEISAWLPDYGIFVEQGYGSLLNLPVVYSGRTIGLINMMGAAGHFDPGAVAAIRRELPLAALALLGCGHMRRNVDKASQSYPEHNYPDR
jgi:hypothetical protein